MNYHIMLDEKFIDGFIEDAEKVSSPGSNVYFVRGDRLNARYAKHPLAKWVNDIWSEEFKEQLHSITKTDRIFIHWYDLDLGKLMLTIDREIPLYVVLWGGDFYEDPSLIHHASWLCDKLTFRFVKRHYIYPQKWARRPALFLRQLWSVINYRKAAAKDFQLKKKRFIVSTIY